MAFDVNLPIFLQDSHPKHSTSPFSGGLGLSIRSVGVIMSINGVIALLIQAIIFPWAASVFGVWRLFTLVTCLHPLAYLVVPCLLILPGNWLYTGIYATLFLRNLFSILVYPLLLILIKEAAPSASQLGRINGLAASTGAACRTLSSPISGILYGLGSKHHFAPLPWYASAAVAGLGAVQILWIQRSDRKEASVRSAAAFCEDEESGYSAQRKDSVVAGVLEVEEEGV